MSPSYINWRRHHERKGEVGVKKRKRSLEKEKNEKRRTGKEKWREQPRRKMRCFFKFLKTVNFNIWGSSTFPFVPICAAVWYWMFILTLENIYAFMQSLASHSAQYLSRLRRGRLFVEKWCKGVAQTLAHSLCQMYSLNHPTFILALVGIHHTGMHKMYFWKEFFSIKSLLAQKVKRALANHLLASLTGINSILDPPLQECPCVTISWSFQQI
jgi:hypothetical protein